MEGGQEVVEKAWCVWLGRIVVEDRPSVGGAIRELESGSSVFDEDTEVLCA